MLAPATRRDISPVNQTRNIELDITYYWQRQQVELRYDSTRWPLVRAAARRTSAAAAALHGTGPARRIPTAPAVQRLATHAAPRGCWKRVHNVHEQGQLPRQPAAIEGASAALPSVPSALHRRALAAPARRLSTWQPPNRPRPQVLHVRNLPPDAAEADLLELCRPFGRVLRVKVLSATAKTGAQVRPR